MEEQSRLRKLRMREREEECRKIERFYGSRVENATILCASISNIWYVLHCL